MSNTNKSIYASVPFKFIVNGNPYYIHADLVSRHSKPLDRMINGQMAEAQQGFAVLEDVDEGTIARFAEWAYKGYYTAAEFKVVGSRPSSAGPINENAAVDFSAETSSESDQQDEMEYGAKTGQELKKSFVQREYTVSHDIINIPPARANREENEDYTEVFLSHARLYEFAEKYDIQLLKTLAFEQLHNTLAIYTLYDKRTGDIIDLLRCVYANTRSFAKGGDDLRELMRDYVGFEMRVLVKDERFSDLMVEDGGPLLWDFMTKVAERIN